MLTISPLAIAVGANYVLFDGFAHLASGLACGLAGLAAGMAIGIVGDAGVRYVDALGLKLVAAGSFRSPRPSPPHSCRANAQQPKLFVGMILILIFAEALALYGLIGGCIDFLHVACMVQGSGASMLLLCGCACMLQALLVCLPGLHPLF